jgi:hypothetical protein
VRPYTGDDLRRTGLPGHLGAHFRRRGTECRFGEQPADHRAHGRHVDSGGIVGQPDASIDDPLGRQRVFPAASTTSTSIPLSASMTTERLLVPLMIGARVDPGDQLRLAHGDVQLRADRVVDLFVVEASHGFPWG